MKVKNFITVCLLLCGASVFGQNVQQTIKMTADQFTVFNRDVDYENGTAHLSANENDGLLWINGLSFGNGIIELDIKGRNLQGQSFVGIAFHGTDNETFDGIYFRPFNFKNLQRNNHSVQYISVPGNDWSTLRNAFPGKYENKMNPVPENPDDWFHAKIVINHPSVKVYVNGNETPSLEVEQLSTTKQGKLGLWVGNGSEGWFRNLTILKK